MELIFKNIKQLITPQFLEEVFTKLGIGEATLIKLSDPIIAGLFGGLLTQGDNAETERMFEDFISKTDDNDSCGVYLLDSDADINKIEAATALGSAVLFGKREEFASFLSDHMNVDVAAVDKLLTTLTYSFGLDLGRKLMTDEYTITGLLGQIHAERNFFLGYIPSGVTSILGLPSLLTIGQNLSSDAKVVSDAVYYNIMHGNTPVQEKKNSWWKWFSFKAAL